MIFNMKDFPRQLEIGENIWRVRFCRTIPGEPDTTLGLCDPSDNTIYVKLGQTPVERFKTFVHEILHAWESEFSVSIPHSVIHDLEEPIFRFLLDNGLVI